MYSLIRSRKKIIFLRSFTLQKIQSESIRNGKKPSDKALGKLPENAKLGDTDEEESSAGSSSRGKFVPTEDWVTLKL